MTEVPGKPFPTVGILGGGQLGRMLALAAIRMGLHVRFLVPEPTGSTKDLGHTTVGDWKNREILIPFVNACDVITVESEWAPLEYITNLPIDVPPCWPSVETLSIIRNKGRQKESLSNAGLPVPSFQNCASVEEAIACARQYTYPVVLKRFEGSYDGYGNATVRSDDQLIDAWALLASEQGLLVEQWIPFINELSVLVARRPDGASVTYPVAYTEQRDHRCHAVEVPASLSSKVEDDVLDISLKAVEAVGGVGITAVELFELEDQSILINELAPRPHNTGHYTIEGCFTSQFENHLRAILNWPLGHPGLRVPSAVMVNILGQRSHPVEVNHMIDAMHIDDVALHIYGKEETRPKRKMGHVTATGDDVKETRIKAEQAASILIL